MIHAANIELWEGDPVVTEAKAFDALRHRLDGVSHIRYVAFPWARFLNGAHAPMDLGQSRGCHSFTVCQHVRFREIIPLLSDAGIGTLFTPHATHHEQSINGVRILGFPHYPSSSRPRVERPDLLFSFIGAPTHPVRQQIERVLGGSDRVVIRDGWHFGIEAKRRGFEQLEYLEVMSRSRFALCPRGAGPSSLRIWEAIASGVVPVVIADSLRLPEGIDWNSCSIRIEESDIGDIPQRLSELTDDDISSLEEGLRKAKAVMDGNFAFPVSTWLRSGDQTDAKSPVAPEPKGVTIFTRDNAPLIRRAVHCAWGDFLVFHSSGRFKRANAPCQGAWTRRPSGLIELKWDRWDPELLTEEGDVLPMGAGGGPIIDLVGRLANQYIWLAYGLHLGAEALRPNRIDGFLLGDIAHGMDVLPPANRPASYGQRWTHASGWTAVAKSLSDLRSLIVPSGLRRVEGIALHARLGDKVGSDRYLPFTRDYASRALSLMPVDLEVDVFSDSPLLARKLVDGLHPRMNFNNGGTPRTDFIEICSRTHHVVADSTFSWLASFVSPFRTLAVHRSNPRFSGSFDYPGLQIIDS